MSRKYIKVEIEGPALDLGVRGLVADRVDLAARERREAQLAAEQVLVDH